MSAATIQPYLFFGGRCEEAVEFYRKALGAEVEMLMRHSDSPDSPPPGMIQPGFENKVMHCCFRIGGAAVMASDGCGGQKSHFDGFRLSLTLPTEAGVRSAFAALSEGGKVDMPPTKTFFSNCFGMVTDRFGVGWMVLVQPPVPAK